MFYYLFVKYHFNSMICTKVISNWIKNNCPESDLPFLYAKQFIYFDFDVKYNRKMKFIREEQPQKNIINKIITRTEVLETCAVSI